MRDAQIDCVLVGYNEPDFRTVFQETEAMRNVSGAYRNLANNTVILGGARLTYMELMSWMLRGAGVDGDRLHVAHLPNLGAWYLRAFLARRGLDVAVVNFFNQEKEHLESLLPGARAVAITTTFYIDAAPIAEIVRFVRERNPNVRIIVGGPHILDICRADIPTQEYLLDRIGADLAICDSQGEGTLAEAIACIRDGGRLEDVPNLIYRAPPERVPLPVLAGGRPRRYHRTPLRSEANSLDENAVDWRQFGPEIVSPTAQMRTARSCAYHCSFCKYPVIAGRLSLASVDAVAREMESLRDSGTKNLVVVDDTFNIPLKRFKEILRMMIERAFDFRWFSFFRCAEADDEAFDLMRASGCTGVFLGIESADPEVLRNMNKHADPVRYEEGIRKLNERGIVTFASFIVGFPGETRQTVEATIRFIERCRPAFYRAEIYYHSMNVPIAERAAQYDLRGGGYSWRHATMDWRIASEMVDHIYTSVKNSIIFPLYGFDFWCIPYLMGKGLTMQQIRRFVAIAQPLLLASQGAEVTSPSLEARTRSELLALGTEIVTRLPVGTHAPAAAGLTAHSTR